MTTELTIELDTDAFGPAMMALVPMQQRFVIAYCTLGYRRHKDAAIAAGYSPNNATQLASNLLRNRRIQDAIAEQADSHLRSGVLLAASVLTEILEDPNHKDRLKAAKMMLEHAKVIVPPEQVIEVKHTVNQKEQIAQIKSMAEKLGLDPRQLLGQYGVTVDAEFEDVTHQVQPQPVLQQLPAPEAGSEVAEGDEWSVSPEA